MGFKYTKNAFVDAARPQTYFGLLLKRVWWLQMSFSPAGGLKDHFAAREKSEERVRRERERKKREKAPPK